MHTDRTNTTTPEHDPTSDVPDSNEDAPEPVGTCIRPTLILPTLVLSESRVYTTLDDAENMHFVAGVPLHGDVTVAVKNLFVPCDQRSTAGASAERAATHKLVIAIHESAHHVVALVHSHPGTGPHATYPSSTDLHTAEKWERGRDTFVSGIWSRDGYLRLFTNGPMPAIEFAGAGIEQLEDDLYYLDTTHAHDLHL